MDAVFFDHSLVFVEISKGYVDKGLGNDVLEPVFHGRIFYCENGKKLGEFVDAEFIFYGKMFFCCWRKHKKRRPEPSFFNTLIHLHPEPG